MNKFTTVIKGLRDECDEQTVISKHNTHKHSNLLYTYFFLSCFFFFFFKKVKYNYIITDDV